MGRHLGDNAIVKVDGVELELFMSFDLKENVDVVKVTALNDTSQRYLASNKPGWDGSFTVRKDWAATAQAQLRAGTTFTFEGYTEGDGTGKTYVSGTAIVQDWNLSGVGEGTPVDSTFTVMGDGPLNIQVVA
ncbi:MAG: hypothetical protein VXY73_07295 [Pseudomonadota bacterium]|nr:hypothetical protein [Pseudomonadota bacterium]